MAGFMYKGRVVIPYLRTWRTVSLRETPKYWIDRYGTKYRKSDGREPGTSNESYLDLETIEGNKV